MSLQTPKNQTPKNQTRRNFLIGGGAVGLIVANSPAMAQVVSTGLAAPNVRRNASSFRTHRWQDHFANLKNGAVLCDTTSRVLQYWSDDESVTRVFPTSVPLSDDLTRLGYTSVVRKVEGPSWRPTPAMKLRDPEWPDYIGPGPDNPLGTHALYLSWQYYRIHGTNDTRKIGRKSSNGCIGLFNPQIADLFELAKVGTQVKLI